MASAISTTNINNKSLTLLSIPGYTEIPASSGLNSQALLPGRFERVPWSGGRVPEARSARLPLEHQDTTQADRAPQVLDSLHARRS